MSITTIFFDLDGTLLPMDNDLFTQAYFKLLAGKLVNYGYEPKKLINSIWQGTKAMVLNDGSKTDEQAFWDKFTTLYPEKDVKADMAIFEDFYKNEFQLGKSYCGFNPKANETIQQLKKMGYRLVLATNPIFPSIATESRIKWAGLDKNDFEIFTTYENSTFCKPNLEYYKDICRKINVDPGECLMVGNDVDEDMVAENLGMKVFLLSDCLLNKHQKDINCYFSGDFDKLMKFIGSLN